jgi:osmotically-inducible protein OsmY
MESQMPKGLSLTLRSIVVVSSFVILPSVVLSGCVPIMVGGVASGMTAVATSAAEERGVGGVISDAELKLKVRRHVAEVNPEASDQVNITVRQGRVLLTGTVENQKMQIDAVRAAWEVSGVRDVIDEIQVGKDSGITQAAKDSWISTQIKTRLLFSDKISSINYEVKTHNGIVYLMGIAQNQQELNEVLNIARHIDGVKQVVSNVTLKDQPIAYMHSPSGTPMTPEPRPYTMPYQSSPYSLPASPSPVSAGSIHQPNTSSAF